MFHIILRLAGQGTGIAFSSVSWDAFTPKLNLLIAFTVLAAEGKFLEELCSRMKLTCISKVTSHWFFVHIDSS